MSYRFLRLSVADIYAERSPLSGPSYPHPQGKRWGIVREDGEVMVYAGPFHAIVSPKRGNPVRGAGSGQPFPKNWLT
jgi:hypothetical protein